MKILIPSEILPSSSHNIRASNIVLYKIIEELLKKNVNIDFLYINTLKKKLTLKDNPFADNPKFRIIDKIEFKFQKKEGKIEQLKKIFYPNAYDIFPILKLKNLITKKLKKIKPDWIFILWSENITHLFSGLNYKVFAYYGNPIPKNINASNFLLAKYISNPFQRFLQYIYLFNLSRIHHNIINKIDIMGNVAKNDSIYYKKKGLKRCIYIQNTWLSKFSEKKIKSIIEKTNFNEPFKICANVGKLNGTANTFGLIYLFDKLLPELKKSFKDEKFELHIFGSERPKEYVLKKNIYPEVIFRGFVKNIDAELIKCPVFLCCNNATFYNVGHTRYLHAWTLGRCVIAHNNVRMAMPEIEHNKNSLLGKNPEEIARNIKKVFLDKKLFSKICFNGYKTFKNNFDPKLVAVKILEEMKNYKVRL